MCVHVETEQATVLDSDIYLAPAIDFWGDGKYVALGFMTYDEFEDKVKPSEAESRTLNLNQVAELRDNLTRILAENGRETGKSSIPVPATV